MFMTITKENKSLFGRTLDEMHKLRKRVFCDRLKWVPLTGEWEVDRFDSEPDVAAAADAAADVKPAAQQVAAFPATDLSEAESTQSLSESQKQALKE